MASKRRNWAWILACGAAACGGTGPGSGASYATHGGVSVVEPAAAPAPPVIATDAWGKGDKAGAAAGEIHTEPGDLPHLELATDAAKKLPLKHTHVKARLTGFVAEVEVTQSYENPFPEPIEAVYVFPLPENSAVDRMSMQIGERTIEAQIEKRGEAKRMYEDARRQGYTAALLEQERPNVFTQSVANIAPGKKIDVVVRYVQDLTYDAGQYEFVFPMVVGPRFMPGEGLASPATGSGTKADTRRVPDASRISPPYVGKGERSGHDVSIEVVADAALPIGEIEAPTHEVVARKPADGTVRLTLAEKDSLPNRDFVLRYRVDGEQPRATLYTAQATQSGGYFSLVLHPPKLDVDALVGQRELLFVVDTSGSMSGTPLGMCRDAMRSAISQLRPVDTFDVITFSGDTRRAFDAPRPANQENVRQALRVVDELTAGGGTMMANAIDVALGSDVEKGRDRYVFFMTDGYVGNEDEILDKASKFVATLEGRGQRARVFGFGVGSSVNRYLIDGLSRAGKGLGVYATNREDPARAVNQFFHYVDRVVLTDVKVDLGALGASELYPKELPDLFASHPLIVHGRFAKTGDAPLFVTARAGDHAVKIPVDVRRAESEGKPSEVFGALWARSKIGDLERDLWGGQNQEAETAITRLGLDFHLVTRFTSFVAVDRSAKVGNGAPRSVAQPVEAPEGVDVDLAGGETAQEKADDKKGKPKQATRAPTAGLRAAPPRAPGTAASGMAQPDVDGDGALDTEDRAEGAPADKPEESQGMASPPKEVDEESAGSPSVFRAAPDSAARRGCGCRMTPTAPDGSALLALAALAALALRRKSRFG